MEELNKKVESIEREIKRITINESPDPQTYKYLINIIYNYVNTLPSQTYSTSAPTGVAVTGSIWCEDTGVLATRKIWVYNGGWIQMK